VYEVGLQHFVRLIGHLPGVTSVSLALNALTQCKDQGGFDGCRGKERGMYVSVEGIRKGGGVGGGGGRGGAGWNERNRELNGVGNMSWTNM
jgi:hypothetical protein